MKLGVNLDYSKPIGGQIGQIGKIPTVPSIEPIGGKQVGGSTGANVGSALDNVTAAPVVDVVVEQKSSFGDTWNDIIDGANDVVGVLGSASRTIKPTVQTENTFELGKGTKTLIAVGIGAILLFFGAKFLKFKK